MRRFVRSWLQEMSISICFILMLLPSEGPLRLGTGAVRATGCTLPSVLPVACTAAMSTQASNYQMTAGLHDSKWQLVNVRVFTSVSRAPREQIYYCRRLQTKQRGVHFPHSSDFEPTPTGIDHSKRDTPKQVAESTG